MNRNCKILCCLPVAVVVFILAAKNWNSGSFWNASCTDIIGIVLAFFVAFLLTDRLVAKRRKYDAIERIILDVRNNVTDPEFFSDKPQSLTLQASCNNKIKYLKDSKTPFIEDDLRYIESQLETIGALNENHKDNLDSVKTDFEKHKLNIINKCDKIQISMFTN